MEQNKKMMINRGVSPMQPASKTQSPFQDVPKQNMNHFINSVKPLKSKVHTLYSPQKAEQEGANLFTLYMNEINSHKASSQ